MRKVTIKLHSVVGRRSYDKDIVFRVIELKKIDGKEFAILYGEDYRLIADAPLEDLVEMDTRSVHAKAKELKNLEEQSFELFQQDKRLLLEREQHISTKGYTEHSPYFQVPGKVLHLDGDPQYLKKCLDLYEKIGVPVHGFYCNEKEMPNEIGKLLDYYRPQIVVITGHDAYSRSKGKKTDLQAYRHSAYFVQTVLEARKKFPHLDQLVIFAGACQSHFESLIHAGANFASSPTRINIHALDPVYIVSKIAYTPFKDHINVWEVVRNTLTGDKGLGGIESKGVLRTGMPYHSIGEEE
ncbi:sporulation peptidase YabG [Bacillus coahuilensis]|uniref:sporulation peptidase YabG n=1 Tax=Bacillus coahuilensis TaxID=408580 RepID=UPI00128FBDC8|nr:sporulation peptidase YabG [Bacillus coahuilensis]